MSSIHLLIYLTVPPVSVLVHPDVSPHSERIRLPLTSPSSAMTPPASPRAAADILQEPEPGETKRYK